MTGEMLAFALSEKGLQETKAFLCRTGDTENELALFHARMEQMRLRKKALETDGANGAEKDALLASMADMERHILAAYKALLSVEGQVRNLIQKLPDKLQRELLEWKHLHHLSFFAAAEKLHVDERHVYRVYKKALQSASVFYHQSPDG